MPHSLEDDIKAAGSAGFDGIEIWFDKLRTYLIDHTIQDLQQSLRDHNLTPVALCPLTIWPFRDTEPARAAYLEAIDLAPRLGCDLVIVCPDFQPARLTREEALDIHAAELATMAQQAGERGVRLAIEPIGKHSLVPGPHEALYLIECAGSPANVGVLMDTFHYFRSQVTLAELERLPMEKLWLVHVNDSEDGAIDELTDGNRVYPTLGVIPVQKQLSLLKTRGYDGYLSVEIFRREYWDQPASTVAAQSFKYLNRLLTQLT
jgi:2-keto-myo-inositol isomerase